VLNIYFLYSFPHAAEGKGINILVELGEIGLKKWIVKIMNDKRLKGESNQNQNYHPDSKVVEPGTCLSIYAVPKSKIKNK
jgi:hypothetical protein